jgi:hypothetical protein
MVGALAGFRQQDAVHGLPLQLSADEITLGLQRGTPLDATRISPLSKNAALRQAGCSSPAPSRL